MKYFLPAAVYIFVLAGAGYFLIKFFSSLSGVNMQEAIIWGFKAKRFELVLPLALVYLIAFVMFAAIVMGLFNSSTAVSSQQGGLLGFRDSETSYAYFDPFKQTYAVIPHFSPPPAADRLNETFDVISFYRAPFSDDYRNLWDMSLTFSLIKTVLFVIGVIPLYFILYALAGAFAEGNGLAQAVSHQLIQKNFYEMTRLKLPVFLGAVVLGIVIITVVEYLIAQSVARGHQNSLGRFAAEYQNRITQHISPGDAISGKIVRRSRTTVKKYTPAKNTVKPDLREKDPQYLGAWVYTVEFSGLLHVPVYVNMQIIGDAGLNQDREKLSSLFDENSDMAINDSNIKFVVNPDYSISLPGSGPTK